MAAELTFESMNDAVEHATFKGEAIICTVAGAKMEVLPGNVKEAEDTPLAVDQSLNTAMTTFVESATSVVHNFEGTPLRKWQLEQLCKGKGCKSANDILNDKIAIRYVYFHPCEVIEPDGGEITTMIRTVLVTPELMAVGFVSTSVATSMMQLHKLFDGKPFDPPVLVSITQKETRRGHRIYVVEPVMEEV